MIVILTRCMATNIIIRTVLAWAVELCSNSGKELFILTTCCIVTTVIIRLCLLGLLSYAQILERNCLYLQYVALQRLLMDFC